MKTKQDMDSNIQNVRYLSFLKTLNNSSSGILNLTDEDLETVILEDLDASSISDLHQSTLDYLIKNGLIDTTIYINAEQLRFLIRNVIDNDSKRNVYSFRNDKDWLGIYAKSDEILEYIGAG